ncbi:FAD-dependent oxidoreductase [Stenotrophomonas sp. SY1]|uniref:FAD-dependent oxidoreductase n=1 Tax=Stenotrophomonas sp. SY1 TaxID=477235 RepID=UPI001E29C4F2|nr:FAD-dependent oxidoreductase [Stenotrophomonas sp. SY1]MCD9088114.1 FAD-dependent oxidoreductase [Stenotrophomonas sp. SY1]
MTAIAPTVASTGPGPTRHDLVIIGAGVVGLASAYAAARRGCSVLLVDRNAGPALGTSFANGAQLSYAYTDAMAGPATWRQLPEMAFGRNGPFRTRWSVDPDFLRWGLAFLRQANAASLHSNTLATLELALESRAAMQALLQRHPIDFHHLVSGKLHLYPTAEGVQGAAAMIALKRPYGVQQRLVDAAEARSIEPALSGASWLAGGVYSPDEEAGDPHRFSESLLDILRQQYGVQASFNFDTQSLRRQNGQWQLQARDGRQLQAARVLVCGGIDSAELLRPTGMRVPVMAIKGYSFTAPCGANAPRVSITDTKRKLVFCRLGEHIRVAGLADLNDWNPTPEPARLAQLVAMARASLPEAADYDHIQSSWAGLRPVTPWSSPIIRNLGDGLGCNIGHGMLGWTLAMGSGERAVSQLLDTL